MKRRYHLNARLLVFAGLAMLTGLAAMNNQNNLLFWIFGMMVASLFISGVVSGAMMTGLSARRIDPGHGAVGEPLVIRYRLHNHNRFFPAFNVHIEDLLAPPRSWWRRLLGTIAALPKSGYDFAAAIRGEAEEERRRSDLTFWRLVRPASALVMHVGAGETVHGEAVLWPVHRGEARFGYVRIWTTFPFGLIRKSITFPQPAHTLIHPRRYLLRRDVLAAISPAGSLGMKSTQRAGVGDDYYGLREYRPGEPARHVAWKRSATRDELICVEHTRPSPPKLRVALNFTAPPAGDKAAARELEETAIILAASLINAADAAGYEVGLSVLGLSMAPLAVRRSQWHLGKMMSALAAIDLDAPRRPAEASRLPDVERVGLIIIHPDRVVSGMGQQGTWHLTARQLERLVSQPIGWDPRASARPTSVNGQAVSTAASSASVHAPRRVRSESAA